MNGQTRARLTGLAGTVALLLTGITVLNGNAIRNRGAEQAIEIAETLNVTQDLKSRGGLGNAFHNDARQATLNTEKLVAADLARTLKRQSAVVMAKATFPDSDRG